MICAFMISTPEEKIVQAVSADVEGPHMKGSLFEFDPRDLGDFITRVQEHAKTLETGSEEYRSAIRLTERLGSWLGQQYTRGILKPPKSKRQKTDITESKQEESPITVEESSVTGEETPVAFSDPIE